MEGFGWMINHEFVMQWLFNQSRHRHVISTTARWPVDQKADVSRKCRILQELISFFDLQELDCMRTSKVGAALAFTTPHCPPRLMILHSIDRAPPCQNGSPLGHYTLVVRQHSKVARSLKKAEKNKRQKRFYSYRVFSPTAGMNGCQIHDFACTERKGGLLYFQREVVGTRGWKRTGHSFIMLAHL
jgi:hypothetical protein